MYFQSIKQHLKNQQADRVENMTHLVIYFLYISVNVPAFLKDETMINQFSSGK
jgi:hypothetical protein